MDATLAAAGDQHAFERLYRAHVARVHSLARRMLSAEEADEATQDIFVRAWQKLGTFRGEAAFGTWLHRLAINVLLSHRSALGTRRARYAADDSALEVMPHRRGSSVEDALDLEAALARIPDGARAVFVLHDVEGYRHEEIADMLDCPLSTVKTRLYQGLSVLRRRLERRQAEEASLRRATWETT